MSRSSLNSVLNHFKQIALDRNRRNYTKQRADIFVTAYYDEQYELMSYQVSKLSTNRNDSEIYEFLSWLRIELGNRRRFVGLCNRGNVIHFGETMRSHALCYESQKYIYNVRLVPVTNSIYIAAKRK